MRNQDFPKPPKSPILMCQIFTFKKSKSNESVTRYNTWEEIRNNSGKCRTAANSLHKGAIKCVLTKDGYICNLNVITQYFDFPKQFVLVFMNRFLIC